MFHRILVLAAVLIALPIALPNAPLFGQEADDSRINLNEQTIGSWHKLAAKKMNCKDCHTTIQDLSLLTKNRGADLVAEEAHSTPHFYDETANEVFVSDFWVGISTEPAKSIEVKFIRDSASLLGKVDAGLRITLVHEDSPAAKSKLQKGDVILRVNNQPVQKLEHLVRLVHENKEKPIECLLVRNQELKTLKVTPAKRPQAMTTQEIAPEDLSRSLIASFLKTKSPQLIDAALFKELPEGASLHMKVKKSANRQHIVSLDVQFGEKSYDVKDKSAEFPGSLQPFAGHYHAYFESQPFMAIDALPTQSYEYYRVDDASSQSALLQQIIHDLKEIKQTMKAMKK